MVIASWVILATAQTAVVVGAMQALHPTWPLQMQVLAAVGYELATLAVGIVIAVRAGEGRGHAPVLWAGLALFVAVSSWFGFDAAMRGLIGETYRLADLASADPVQWVRAVLGGAVLPVQYLLAVAAGHQLASAVAKRDAASAKATDAARRDTRRTTRAAPVAARSDRRKRVLAAASRYPSASQRELARSGPRRRRRRATHGRGGPDPTERTGRRMGDRHGR
jgi:hypothetical protein